jgi:predicted DNA-binding protein (MmcQ/YjbR family)
MDIEAIRNYCLTKPDVEEGFPFGPTTLVFKTNNKIFLLASLDAQPLQFNVKCNPEKAIELREMFPEAVLPGYHMNKKHWNTIIIDGTLTTKQIMEMVDDSYDLVKAALPSKGGFKKAPKII